MTPESTQLLDGPLSGQKIRVTPGRGGALPEVIYCHAKLPFAHQGEPTGRHQYVRTGAGYAHSDACRCLSGAHGVRSGS